MGGFDNETSIEFSKQVGENQRRFISKRVKLHQQWKKFSLDKKMTFLEFCKLKPKKRKNLINNENLT
tara:strand:- start:207 stop:407 length:201 start_codon:yes stop_codon:yes gene_type:complete